MSEVITEEKEETAEEIYSLTKEAANIAVTKKASDVRILDLRELTSMTDYFVICSGEVDAQVKAITDEIEKELKDKIEVWNKEGYENLEWVLLDYIDFVVHIFQKDTREYYNIEKLWKKAPQEIIAE